MIFRENTAKYSSFFLFSVLVNVFHQNDDVPCRVSELVSFSVLNANSKQT